MVALPGALVVLVAQTAAAVPIEPTLIDVTAVAAPRPDFVQALLSLIFSGGLPLVLLALEGHRRIDPILWSPPPDQSEPAPAPAPVNGDPGLGHCPEGLRLVGTHVRDAVLIIDRHGRIAEATAPCLRLLGVAPAALLDRPLTILAPILGLPQDALVDTASGQPRTGTWPELSVRPADGPPLAIEARLLPDPDSDGAWHVLVCCEIEDSQRHLIAFEQLARHDTLTVLPNREAFFSAVEAATRVADDIFAVVLIDLDRFGQLNVTFGWTVGDRLLTELGARLWSLEGPLWTVGRLGGDQFGTLFRLPPTYRHDQPLPIGPLEEILQRPFVIDGTDFRVSASYGVAIHPWHGDNAGTLLEAADLALAEAKARGRAHAMVYQPSLSDRARRAARLAQDLQRALDLNALSLVYQPQIDLSCGRVVGFEALARWTDGDGCPVSPAEFIPVAEQSGAIVRLGAWVMLEACRFCAEMRQRWNWPVRMAVNVAAQQFHHPNFLEMVQKALAETGLPPDGLEIELTERALLEFDPGILDKMARLREWGISVSLDDFGTGYSSLGLLSRLPIDRIKLDRSFVERLPGDSKDVAIVLTIVELARSLSLELLAEGVEQWPQAEFLRTHGCTLAQGYLFGRPMPGDLLLDRARHPDRA